jgi:activator of Hsp90 ATPase-like protein
MSATGSRVSIDGRPALRFERRLGHPIERVWRAVTEPAELERWFVASVAWTPAAGETFEAAGETGRITAVEPPQRLAWTWGVERYAFELTPDGDGCVLAFTHVFDPRLGPDWQHAAGWETYFDRLAVHLGGGFLSEGDAHAGIDARMAHYRATFGSPAPGA